MDDYSSAPGINWSTLSAMRKSPMAYRYLLENGRPDSSDFAIGRLLHSLVLEPSSVVARYAIWNGGFKRGKEWVSFKEDNPGLTIVGCDEFDECVLMAEAVEKAAGDILDICGARIEIPLFWNDPITGLRCKAKPDYSRKLNRILIDLKSCRSIDEREFGASAARYGYHCQLAHYANGIGSAYGWKPKEVIIIAVEKYPPYDTAIFELSEDDLWAGAEEVGELLAKVKECQESGIWPGRYAGERRPLLLPAWSFPSESINDFGLKV